MRYNNAMKKLFGKIPLWLVVLALGITFIIVGIFQGGFDDTLRKAALVCYECIGIG